MGRRLGPTLRGSSLFAAALAACATFHDSDEPPQSEVPDATAISSDALSPFVDAAARTSGMVLLKVGAASFYVDAREASVDEYNRIVGTNPWASIKLPDAYAYACSFHSNWGVRGSACSGAVPPKVANASNLPVNCVDWCDALAFCVAQGKRLCGGVNGRDLTGVSVDAEAPSPEADEWMFACGGPDAQPYPYGTTFDGTRCNVVDGGLEAIDASSSCEGFFGGTFNLVGSLNEWENACLSGNRAEFCSVRGGAYRSSAAASTCPAVRVVPRQGQYDDVGIRCCADP